MSDENVRDRREMLLKAVGDGDAESINPRDYTEKLLSEAAEGEETRSNAREHADLFINAITVGSGTNPNSVVTVNGTLENPWGDLVYSDLVDAVRNRNASVYMTVEWTDYTSANQKNMVGTNLVTNRLVFHSGGSSSDAIEVLYNTSGGNATAVHFSVSSEEINDPDAATVLTVIYHPLPTA